MKSCGVMKMNVLRIRLKLSLPGAPVFKLIKQRRNMGEILPLL